MGLVFNPLIFSGFDIVPPAGSGVPVVPTAASLPVSGNEGDLCVVQDTGYIYEWRNTPMPGWVIVAGPGAMLGVGTIDSATPSADGAVNQLNSLVLQSASDTVPGLVNNAFQQFSGDKLFQDRLFIGPYNPSAAGVQYINTNAAADAMAIAYGTGGSDPAVVLKFETGTTFNIQGTNGAFNALSNIGLQLQGGYTTVGNSTSRLYSAGDSIVQNNKGLYLSPSADASNGPKGILGWVPEDPYGLDTYGGPAPAIALQGIRTAGPGAPYDLAFSTTISHPTLVERMRLSSVGYLGIANNHPSSVLTVGDPGTTIYGGGPTNEPTAVIAGTPPSVDPARGIMSIVDTSAMAADVGGSLTFLGNFLASGGQTFYGGIKGYKTNATDGDYGGGLKFYVHSFTLASTLPALTLTDAANAVFFNDADFQNLGQINNVVDPTAAQDVATKNYVDNRAPSGLTVITGNHTVLNTEYKILCNQASAGSYTITLPAGTHAKTFVLGQSATNAASFTIAASGGDSLDANIQIIFDNNQPVPVTFDSGTSTWYPI